MFGFLAQPVQWRIWPIHQLLWRGSPGMASFWTITKCPGLTFRKAGSWLWMVGQGRALIEACLIHLFYQRVCCVATGVHWRCLCWLQNRFRVAGLRTSCCLVFGVLVPVLLGTGSIAWMHPADHGFPNALVAIAGSKPALPKVSALATNAPETHGV